MNNIFCPQPKMKRIVYQPYIDWLKKKPCVKTGHRSNDYMEVVPAHQTLGFGGMALKGHDIWALPLRADLHACQEHHKGHLTFWEGRDIALLIIEHWKRYSDETGDTFWAPMDLTKMIVEDMTNGWRKVIS